MSHNPWYAHDEEAFLRAEKTLAELRERRQAEIYRVESELMDALTPDGAQAGLTLGQLRSLVRLIATAAPAVKKILDSTNLGYVPYWERLETIEPAAEKED